MNLHQALFELDVFGFTVVETVLSANEVGNMAELLDQTDRDRGVEYSYNNAMPGL